MEKLTVEKPWGQFVRYSINEKSTVKIHTVNPNQALSLQYHHHRDEFWKVIKGRGKILVNDRLTDAKEGDEFFIKAGEKHRMITESSEMKVLEICFGDFDENDIVRLEDKYKRK
jgi:mannose-6-phosphate isomerase